MSNRLADSTSPYLLQHAHNPVDWFPWGEEALHKAKAEDKPILVSIGYSACHWCHVMERESFENEEIANFMNAHFVCIKIDREERPDIDQVYMEAVQTMGLHGGWPLNVFTTPEQKPFYGGTYFPPQNWLHMLQQIVVAFKEKRDKINESAYSFAHALQMSEVEKYSLASGRVFGSAEKLQQIVGQFKKDFDHKDGGLNKAPKFPMPSMWHFLLHANALLDDEELDGQLELTLDKMALGGIFDQIGGGFARYSVDSEWLAPHFEKMLYDNGQLLSLYADAYRSFNKDLYKEVVHKIVQNLKDELISGEGAFYAALDADSEGEEGKYYVWSLEEFNEVLGQDAALIADYYEVSDAGNWEGHCILRRRLSDEEFCDRHEISQETLNKKLLVARARLLDARQKRIKPGLDNKILTGWNAMMVQGLADAYKVFGDAEFLELAKKNLRYIAQHHIAGGKLFRSAQKDNRIPANLEDYAFLIGSLISMYQVTFDPYYADWARDLTSVVIEEFYDTKEELFFYTSKFAEKLISRKKELFDNVVPATNSVMAHNLYWLGILFDEEAWRYMAEDMLGMMMPLIEKEPQYLGHWARLYYYICKPTAEIAIVGEENEQIRRELERLNLPNKLMMGMVQGSDLPLLEGKEALNGKTTIYVCYNKTCKLPVHTIKEALSQLT